jgi:hypothetical protein
MDPSDTKDNSDVLHHVLLEVVDYHKDSSGATRTIDVLKTYSSLPAAKSYAYNALQALGYSRTDFDEYDERKDSEDETTELWQHDDGVLVHARAPAGQVFSVRIDTTPNAQGMKASPDGVVEDPLYYVVQTRIDYNADRTGGKEMSGVEGVFRTRREACSAAYKALLDEGEGVTKESFAEYEEKGGEEGGEDWPYGDDVLVHAVTENGENFLVAVKAQLKSHE